MPRSNAAIARDRAMQRMKDTWPLVYDKFYAEEMAALILVEETEQHLRADDEEDK